MAHQSEEPDTYTGLFSAPLWKSAFRPFYLAGVIYGLGIMTAWILLTAGLPEIFPRGYSLSLWHGHEMIFGFSGAIITGFILTALPGWAGTDEIRRGPLAFLLLLWIMGRVAFLLSPHISSALVLILDSSFFPVVMVMVTPGLLRARDKYYLALLPLLALLFCGNVIFHLAIMDGDLARASWGIRMGIMGIIVKFILAGGFLATIFTGNALGQKNGPEVAVWPFLEYISALSLILLVYGALADIPEKAAAGLAFFAAFIQMIRLARWRSWLLLDAPLVLVMHLSYLWFIASLILFGAAAFSQSITSEVWIHAFAVGALSMMMLSLITRVARHHTGRALVPERAMLLSFALMCIVAFFRVMISLGFLSPEWLPLAAAIWSLSFLIYILHYGLILIRPGLPEKEGPKNRPSELGKPTG